MVVEVVYLKELTWLSILLIIGVLCTLLARKIKISEIFLLILAGLIIGRFEFIDFDTAFLTTLGLFALIMILFDSTSKFKPKEFARNSPSAFKLAMVFFVLNVIFLTLFTHLIFNWGNLISFKLLLLSLLFATLMAGTSPSTVLSIIKNTKQKIVQILDIESIMNTPFVVLFPLIILNIYIGSLQPEGLFLTFLQNIMTGIGTGLFLGLVIFKLVMEKKYSEQISPLAIIAMALLSYTLAEQLGGNGILSVTTLGLVFASSNIKQKLDLEKFISIFTSFLRIVIFILLGVILILPGGFGFIFKSGLLFLIYLIIRYYSVRISFPDISFKEKIFMSLQVSKGVAAAVIVFILAAKITTLELPAFEIQSIKTILDLAIAFILYSIILGTIVSKFSNYFLTKSRIK